MRADRDSVYGVAGLRLQCPWPLPYLPYAERDGELDMRVIVSAGDPGEATAHDSWLTVTRSDAGYRISIGDLVTCDIDRNGTEIHLSASGALPTETLSHLLIDHILPLVLTLRGRHVVHASAVLLTDGVIAFIGASGAGKSTLAAALHHHGHPVLTDDCITIRIDHGAVWVEGLYPALRLWPETAVALGENVDQMPAVAHYTDKRRAVCAFQLFGERPLQQIYLIDRNGTDPYLEPLSKREQFVALTESLFHIPGADGLLRRQFDFADEMLAHITVSRLSLPDDLARLSDTVDMLSARNASAIARVG